MHFTITHNPDLALLLTGVGVAGIYREFCAPGKILPGVAGTSLALLGAAALVAFPVSPTGMALILASMSCFVLEAMFESRGIFTAAGAAAMLIGMKTVVVLTDPARQIHWATAISVALPISLATSFLLSAAVRARRNKFGEQQAASQAGDILIQGENEAES